MRCQQYDGLCWRSSPAMPYRTRSIFVFFVIFTLSYNNACHSSNISDWTRWIHFSDQLGHNLSTRYRSPNDTTINCSYNTSNCCYELNVTDSDVVHTGRTENATTLLEQLSCSSNGQVDRNEKGEKMCNCPRQYTGIFCEIRSSYWTMTNFVNEQISGVNGCHSEQCVNDGVCVENESGYRCICKPGFNGQHCEKTAREDNPRIPEEDGNDKVDHRKEDNKLLTVYVAPVLIAGILFLILLAGTFAKKALVKSYANINVWFHSGKRKENEQSNAKQPLTPEEMLKLEELQMTSNMEVLRLTLPYSTGKGSDSPNEPTEIITLSETQKSATISPEYENADKPQDIQVNKEGLLMRLDQQETELKSITTDDV